jgi:hypothetical protein
MNSIENNLTTKAGDVKEYFQGRWRDFFSHYMEPKNGKGDEYQARCPLHDDSDPSFSFNDKTGQCYCFGCKFGGDAFQFYGKIKGVASFPEIVKGIAGDFGIPGIGKKTGSGRLVETYDYTNEEGDLLNQVVRMEPKSFRQRRPDGQGGYIWNMKNVEPVLYRLPEVLQADQVCVAEGEKDADNLSSLGMVATTNVGGAEKWRAEYSESLKDKDIVILPDNDEPGRKHGQKVARMLHGSAKSVKVIQLPGLPEKGDVSDWIEAGGTKDALQKLIDQADGWEPGAETADHDEHRTGLDACVVGFTELLKMDIPERIKIFPWLPEGGIVMVYGGRGIGKTFFTLSLAGSVSTGVHFLKWGQPSKRVGVLIVDGEMALSDLRSRLTALLIKQPVKPVMIISSEVAFAKTDRDINLVDSAQRNDILSILDENKEIRLVIIDNISCLFSGIRESSKDDWEQITPWLLAMRRRGVAVVLVHHAGKGGDQRGTSGREDLLDTVIRLERVHGAFNDGARFIVRFTKSRGAYGDEVEPFEASLDLEADELWTWRKLEESNYERMIALARDGVSTVTDMAEELGITKGSVSKLKKKGIDTGDLAKGSTIKLIEEEQ